MKLKNIHRTILSFGIISIVITTPILTTNKRAAAQTVGFGATNTSYSSGGSLTGIVGDLSPLIKQLPGCTSVLGTGNLFGGIKKVFSGKNNEISKNTDTESLTDLVTQASAELMGVPTYDANLQQMVSSIKTQQKTQGETLDRVDKSTSSDNKNNTCLNSIGKAVVKMIVDKMTVSIVNWINTGNSGDSFFVKNPSKYFKDLAKEQILTLGQELKDSSKYPFAKNFIASAATNYNSTFQQNAQYTLGIVLQDMQQNALSSTGIPTPITPNDFFNDFSKGGWGAWDALTQNSANNPLGFRIMASNELQNRLVGTEVSPAEEIRAQLAYSGGFLNQEKCVDPIGVTKEEDAAALAAGVTIEQGSKTVANSNFVNPNDTTITGTQPQNADGNLNYINNSYTTYRRCKQWETVTPGQTIASALTKKMDNTENALLSADTLNDAIAAILDAVLAKTSSKLTTEGLAALSEKDYSAGYDTGNYDDNGLADYQISQTDRDFSDYQRDSSPWLEGHPDFNIRTDITQALIDEQRIYVEKLKKLNDTLLREDSSTYSGYNGLIPTIYQLDYCIPGPHPDWEEDAQKELDKVKSKVSGLTVKGISETAGYDLLSVFTLGIGTTIIDTVNSFVFDCGDDGLAGFANTAASILANFTGLMGSDDIIGENNLALCSPGGFSNIVQNLFDAYVPIAQDHYNTKTLPSVASEAANKFREIAGYRQMVLDNKNAIAYQEGIIKRLQTIKAAVESLNAQFNNGQGSINETQYEEQLVIWKNSFARISSGLVSGGDIAHVDDLAKQAEDERVYVLTELLQGPAGCEKELLSVQTPLMYWDTTHNWMDWYNHRPVYPYELLYMVSPTGYNYNNTIHNLNTPGNGAGFLTHVTYYDGCALGDNWRANSGFTNDYSDVIYLSTSSCTDNVLNVGGDHIGGNTKYLEKMLKIY